MLRVGPYVFKKAETDQEFDQIHRLNYRSFANEQRQYADSGADRLIDKFHQKNIYFIGVKNGRVVGMLSAHDQPPFSITDRLPNAAMLQQPGMDVMEVRLFAVEPEERHSNLFFGMVYAMYDYALKQGKTHLVISGLKERTTLYQRLGFVPMGPAVPSGQALFVPMILEVGELPRKMQRVKRLWETHVENMLQEDKFEWTGAEENGAAQPNQTSALAGAEICLLPGPVTISPAVRRAYRHPPIYHRGPDFIQRFAQVRQTLGDMVGGRRVAILTGSGTLGNETVAANLAAINWNGRGLMLANGEFGNRLHRQAARFGLKPRVLSWEWGQPWNLDEIADALADEPAGWIWGVHQESSTGVLNDLSGLVRVAAEFDVKVCADCISSLGAVPLDLGNVLLATGTSGKSLGSYAGAAIVFADPQILDMVNRDAVPSYFDLTAALSSDGPCYTFPSSTLLALEAALAAYETPAKAQAVYEHYHCLGCYVREQLSNLGLPPLAPEDCASPVVTTFAPPQGETSVGFVERLLSWGVAIGGQSGYLAKKRFVQIATMGAADEAMCRTLFDRLGAEIDEQAMMTTAVNQPH